MNNTHIASVLLLWLLKVSQIDVEDNIDSVFTIKLAMACSGIGKSEKQNGLLSKHNDYSEKNAA